MRRVFQPDNIDAVNECREKLKEVVMGLEKDWICKCFMILF